MIVTLSFTPSMVPLNWSLSPLDTEEAETELTTFNDKIVAVLKVDRADAEALAAFVEAIDWAALGGIADEG